MSHPALSDYLKQLERIAITRKKTEIIAAKGELDSHDLASAYEGMFLRAVVGMELYCETFFYAVVQGQVRYPKAILNSKFPFTRSEPLTALLIGDKDYLEWLPYKKTRTRFEQCFSAVGPDTPMGRPFLDLPQRDEQILDKVVAIRHAIAHSSEHAMTKFEKLVTRQYSMLLPHEKTPIGFLRSTVTGTPPQTRFEGYIGDLGSIAKVIYGSPRLIMK